MQQEQMAQAAKQSAASLAEQQREFDINQQQSNTALANTQALQAQNQAQVDQQAALTKTWETGRAAEQDASVNSVNDAFASFTPDYYKQFTKAYTDHYQPLIDQQFGAASNQTQYGLAREGNLNSQTAADQNAQLQVQKGTAEADLNNQAVGATTALQTNVINAKNNLMSQATSDATLGSPITPGSADAISADFNNTTAALAGLKIGAGDTVTALQATPQYSSLGTLFGTAAGTAGAAISGNTAYNNYQAFNSGAGAGAANATSSSSGIVR
jgi:hypothetical protein